MKRKKLPSLISHMYLNHLRKKRNLLLLRKRKMTKRKVLRVKMKRIKMLKMATLQ